MLDFLILAVIFYFDRRKIMAFGLALCVLVMIPLGIWLSAAALYGFVITFFFPHDHPRWIALAKPARETVSLSDLAFWHVPEDIVKACKKQQAIKKLAIKRKSPSGHWKNYFS